MNWIGAWGLRCAPALIFLSVIWPPALPGQVRGDVREASEVIRVEATADTFVSANTVVAATISGDGTLLLRQWNEPAVLRYDSQGQPLGRLGRRGHGPGEFQRIAAIGLRTDSLWVWDSSARRLTIFSPDFSQSVVFHPGIPVRDPWYTQVGLIGLLADGTAIASPGFTREGLARGVPRPILRVRRNGEVLDTVFRLPLAGSILVTERSMWAYSPLGDQSLVAIAPNGSFLVGLDRTAPTAGGTARYEVEIRPLAAPPIRRTYSYRAVPVPRRVRDSLLDHAVRQMADGLDAAGRRATREAISRQMRLPGWYPPVQEMFVGADDRVWLRLHDGTPDEGVWLVLDRDGDPLARVRVARHLRVLAADSGHIWAAEDDLNGLSTLIKLRY